MGRRTTYKEPIYNKNLVESISSAVELPLSLIHTYTMSLSLEQHVREVQPQLPFFSSLVAGSQVYGMVALVRVISFLRNCYRYFFPSEYEPNATKTYKIRPHLPIRYIYILPRPCCCPGLKTLSLIEIVKLPTLTALQHLHTCHLFCPVFHCKFTNTLHYPWWRFHYWRTGRRRSMEQDVCRHSWNPRRGVELFESAVLPLPGRD